MKNKILQDLSFYDYSNIEISFSIKTKILDLNSLIDLLKVKPTRGWSFGEKYMGKQLNPGTKEIEKVERQRPFTLFVIETRGLVDSLRFNEHYEFLIKKLQSIKNSLKTLLENPQKFEIIIQIYLTIDDDQDCFGFSFDSNTMRILSEYCHLVEWRKSM